MTKTATLARPVAALGLCAVLAGCGGLFATEYARPDLNVPGKWEQPAPAMTVPDAWWRAFGDADLDALVAEALARNNDVTRAALKVRRALLEADIAQGDLWPSLSASATGTGGRHLSDRRQGTRSGSAAADVTFDPDPWGYLARTRDAADLEARAAARDLDDAALNLTATTVDLYWTLIYYRQRVALSEESVAYARRTLELVQVKYDAGAAGRLDVVEAEQRLRKQEAADTQYRQSLTETGNALAVIFDGPPAPAKVKRAELPMGDLPPVDAGLPARLLERRPDLRAAEARLAETLAGADATRLNYLPRITLTGEAGSSSSTALIRILRDPVGTLGAGLVLPFLDWQQMRRNIKVAEIDYALAVADFRQTVYEAMAEVENGLSARRRYEDQGRFLARSLETAREAERLYEERYREGATTLQLWLDAQETRRSAEESLLENRLNRLTNQVALCKALGGGADLGATLSRPE